ncbi:MULTISPECIES: hypothetical protein [Giesbergeria]|uniref:Uncharacterized protein n=1 Tax=Giesbergeria sinuosa TaxID=80883 RepID=A0ABV9QBN2_9BURK
MKKAAPQKWRGLLRLLKPGFPTRALLFLQGGGSVAQAFQLGYHLMMGARNLTNWLNP